nr:MAG TPA: hypothetical protein [Caudoviricetes sp.]
MKVLQKYTFSSKYDDFMNIFVLNFANCNNP